ncbi:MAG: hypothetical protein L6Q83_02005 [Gammaproteobacteria bacterium]|nr:hypothetical protein [Gammaproteobacteria bacterium]
MAIGLSPFCLGALALAVLLILPGAEPRLHLFLVLASMVALVVALRNSIASMSMIPSAQRNDVRILIGVCMAIALMIGVVVSLTPFTQNDALEYALMARILFDERSLAALPVLDPAGNAYGAYLPWTHPPLYPALLYLSHAMLNSADAIGLGRWVAPWFLASAAAFTFASGLWIGVRTALLASLLLVTAPLLFLGTAAGLIDALPVSASAMLLAVACWVGGSSTRRSVVAGAALGVSLYTHSEAVLFVPLFAAVFAWRWGLHAPLRRLRELGLAALVMLLVAAWPYLRNLATLGVVVGDNPAVFQIAAQAWGDYFTIMRGIDLPAAVAQYGLLKGWFAPEAYGAVFWLMLLALARVLSVAFSGGFAAFVSGRVPVWSRGMVAAILLIACYHAGVLVMVLAGEEILIKNERYLLVVLPAVALVVASIWGASSSADAPGTATNGAVHSGAGRALLSVVLVLQAAVCLAFPLARAAVGGSDSWSIPPVAQSEPAIAPLWRVRDELASSTGVLSMRPGDLYFVESRMVSVLDPRLLPFYAATSADVALSELRRLGVEHVHLPESFLPPVFNSQLASLLADPRLFTRISGDLGVQVFRMGDSGLRPRRTDDLSPSVSHWERSYKLVIGGRKALASVVLSAGPLPADGRSVAPELGGLFHRDRAIALRSPAVLPNACEEHVLGYTVSGRGSVRVWVTVENGSGSAPRTSRRQIADFFLSDAQDRRSLAARIALPPGARQVWFEFEHAGSSAVTVESVRLTCLVIP